MPMILGGELGYRLLCRLAPPAIMAAEHAHPAANPAQPESMLVRYFGQDFWKAIIGATVIDFGCGFGGDAIELIRRGARQVIGIDIREWVIERARQNATTAGVSDRCIFDKDTPVRADVITSVDVFEHVANLADELQRLHRMLAPRGCIWASFGPTWYHPKGGHMFSIFPWSHILFTERALMRWRASFKPGPPLTRITDTDLGKMTISRFLRTVERSPLRLESLDLVPIRSLRVLHTRATREWTTAVVRCRLVAR
jgi:SAM-dependent methyltransferase